MNRISNLAVAFKILDLQLYNPPYAHRPLWHTEGFLSIYDGLIMPSISKY